MAVNIEILDGSFDNIIFPSFITTIMKPEYIPIANTLRNKSLTHEIKSTYDFWEENKNIPEIHTMKSIFEDESKPIISKFFNDDKNISIRRGWLNANRPGEAEQPHHHGNSNMIGVFYIQTPENSGGLMFIDPRGSTAMTSTEFENYNGKIQSGRAYKRIVPKEGLLIFFPSHLIHYVETNQSRMTRLSLACNF